jgi:hypothetical protein
VPAEASLNLCGRDAEVGVVQVDVRDLGKQLTIFKTPHGTSPRQEGGGREGASGRTSLVTAASVEMVASGAADGSGADTSTAGSASTAGAATDVLTTAAFFSATSLRAFGAE